MLNLLSFWIYQTEFRIYKSDMTVTEILLDVTVFIIVTKVTQHLSNGKMGGKDPQGSTPISPSSHLI